MKFLKNQINFFLVLFILFLLSLVFIEKQTKADTLTDNVEVKATDGTTKGWRIGVNNKRTINGKVITNKHSSPVYVPIDTMNGEWEAFSKNTENVGKILITDDNSIPEKSTLTLKSSALSIVGVDVHFEWSVSPKAVKYQFTTNGTTWTDLGSGSLTGKFVGPFPDPLDYKLQIRGCRAISLAEGYPTDAECCGEASIPVVLGTVCEKPSSPSLKINNSSATSVIVDVKNDLIISWGNYTSDKTIICGLKNYEMTIDNGLTWLPFDAGVKSPYTSSLDFTSLAGQTVSVMIRACNKGGCGNVSNKINVIFSSITNTAPGTLSVTNNSITAGGNTTFNWGAVSGVTSYTANVNGTDISLNSSSNSYPARWDYAGSYKVKIKACNQFNVCGPYSNEVTLTVKPGTLTGLLASYTSPLIVGGKINFSWNNVLGATDYEASGDGGSTWGSLNSTNLYYNNLYYNTAGTYSIKVRGCNRNITPVANQCGLPASVSFVVNSASPGAITSFTVNNSSSATVTYGTNLSFKWSSIANTTYYETNINSTGWSSLGNITTYNSNAWAVGTYSVLVRACNTGGCGGSRSVSAIVKPACTPKTCSYYPNKCGSLDNGCGSNISCACPSGYNCSAGNCVANCTNECTTDFITKTCSNIVNSQTTTKTCGNYDADLCKEYSLPSTTNTSCSYGCSNGSCCSYKARFPASGYYTTGACDTAYGGLAGYNSYYNMYYSSPYMYKCYDAGGKNYLNQASCN